MATNQTREQGARPWIVSLLILFGLVIVALFTVPA
jgi:Na+/melibiose symporter-like transporter